MNKYMQIAYDKALEGMQKSEGGPFGAVIVHKGKVIAATHNRVLQSNDPTAHAEVNAIRQASKILNTFNLSECTLYTTCMPCPMCLGAIFWARIGNVYYGSESDDAQKAGFDDALFYEKLEKREFNLHQIDKENCNKLFIKWIEKKDRVIY